MSISLYQFREHNLMVEGERDDLVDLAGRLRDAEERNTNFAWNTLRASC